MGGGVELLCTEKTSSCLCIMAVYGGGHKKRFRYSIKHFRYYILCSFEGGDVFGMRYISFLWRFREAAAFGGLL